MDMNASSNYWTPQSVRTCTNFDPERSDHQARKRLLDTQGCCFQGRRMLSIRSMVINDLVGAEKQPTLL
jgi:hypothetical protein